MIIRYDMSPDIPVEKRLQSLAESAQRAVDDLEGRLAELEEKVKELSKKA